MNLELNAQYNMKILKFYSETCGPCKVLESKLKNYPHENINIEEESNDELVEKYNIKSVPTTIILDTNNEEIKRFPGIFDTSFLDKLLNVTK